MSILNLVAASTSSYGDSATANDATTAAGLLIGIIVYAVIYAAVGFLLYRIFQKAGRPGWAGFVPVYNGWVLFEISGKPGWWALVGLPSFIPLLGIPFLIATLVLSLLAMLELAKRFGKGPVFGVLALWFFSIIGFIILAFDDSKYQAAGVAATPTTAPAPSTPPPTTDNNTPSQTPPNVIQ